MNQAGTRLTLMILLAPLNFCGSSVTQSVMFFTYNQSEKPYDLSGNDPTQVLSDASGQEIKCWRHIWTTRPPSLHYPDENRMAPFFSASLHSRKGTPSTQSRCLPAERGLLAQCQSPRCAFQVQQRTSAWPSAYHNHLLYKDPSRHLKAYTSVSSEKMTFATF